MGLLEKMFGKDGVGKQIRAVGGKIKAFRQANLDRREKVANVKRKIQQAERGTAPAQINKEAIDIATKHGVPYADALEYIKSEKKSASRKESLRKIAGILHNIGEAAKQSNEARAKQDRRITFQQPDITKSRMPKSFFRQP